MLNFAMVLLHDIPTNVVAKATFPPLLLLVFFCGSFNSQLSNLSVLLGYVLKEDEVERCNMRYIKLSSMSNTNQFNYLMVFIWSNKINTFFLRFQVCYNISRILIIKNFLIYSVHITF
jgi:hypothetical protein